MNKPNPLTASANTVLLLPAPLVHQALNEQHQTTHSQSKREQLQTAHQLPHGQLPWTVDSTRHLQKYGQRKARSPLVDQAGRADQAEDVVKRLQYRRRALAVDGQLGRVDSIAADPKELPLLGELPIEIGDGFRRSEHDVTRGGLLEFVDFPCQEIGEVRLLEPFVNPGKGFEDVTVVASHPYVVASRHVFRDDFWDGFIRLQLKELEEGADIAGSYYDTVEQPERQQSSGKVPVR